MYLILIGGLFLLSMPMLMYALYATYVVLEARKRGSLVVLSRAVLILLLPVIPWEYSRLEADWRHSLLTEFLASVKHHALVAPVPNTILIEDDDPIFSDYPVIKCPLQIILDKRRGGSRYSLSPFVALDRETGTERGPAVLPTNYLRFTSGSNVDVKIPGGLPSYRVGPYQLTEVQQTRETLISYGYNEVVQRPTFPPILTSAGWLSAPMAPFWPEKPSASVFLNSALGKCDAWSQTDGKDTS